MKDVTVKPSVISMLLVTECILVHDRADRSLFRELKSSGSTTDPWGLPHDHSCTVVQQL